MRQTHETLTDRIAKGEAFLRSLAANDPKRSIAERNLRNLKRQVSEGVNSGLYEPPLIDVDPRPDLTDDSEKWTALLKMAMQDDAKFCGVLNGMRCGGTRIRPAKTGSGALKWILRPDIDPSGRLAWESLADYEQMRDKYLKPYFDAATALLQNLAEKFPPSDVSPNEQQQ